MTAVDMSKIHVLVVDDDVFALNLMKRVLEELGTDQISSAADGYEALAVLQEAERKVDVILLDLEMPRLNGFGFIEKLRNELLPPLSKIPVVVITGHSNKEALDRVYELGVGLFLQKPISTHQVVTRISAAMRQEIK
jgi:CheY-like chemotaxis protein